MRLTIFNPLFFLLAPLLLTGCVSAVFTGASSVYNNYSIRENVNNSWVELQAINNLNSEKTITDNSHIAVTTVNFVMLLTGQANNNAVRQYAVNLVKNIPGVRRVVNAITVGQVAAVNQALQDSWITTKIESQLFDNKFVDISNIKVVTTNGGVVFLMGVVPQQMANIAIEIAQHTQGVRKVIRLFEIVTVKAE